MSNVGIHTDLSLERILDSAMDGVFVLDRNRRYVYFNARCEKITGHRRSELLGQTCTCGNTLKCEDDWGRSLVGSLCPIRALLGGERDTARQRMQIQRGDGTPVWIETVYSVLRDGSGQIDYVIGVMRDATEAKERETELIDEMTDLRRQVEALGGVSDNPFVDSATHALPQAPGASLQLDPTLEEVERVAILRALRAAGGQRSKAAELMKISRSRLYRRMDALGIDPSKLP